GQDPVLRAPAPRPPRPHRLGAGEVPVRRHGRGDAREAAVRVLLPPSSEPRVGPPPRGAHLPQRRREGRPMTPRPSVTVVVPTYNEETHLRRTLASIAAQTYEDV